MNPYVKGILVGCIFFIITRPLAIAGATHPTPQATLILNNGSTVLLGQTKDGFVCQQGIYNIYKRHNVIAYSLIPGAKTLDRSQNTIVTPASGQWFVVLPDSTRIAMNVSSSIGLVLSSQLTSISMKGEAEFIITRHNKRQFQVIMDTERQDRKLMLTTAGARININAYPFMKAASVTMLDGKAELLSDCWAGTRPREKNGAFRYTAKLKSGHQVLRHKNGNLQYVFQADTLGISSWKEGALYVRNVSLFELFNIVSCWFGVELKMDMINLPDDAVTLRMNEDVDLENIIEFTKRYCEGMHVEYIASRNLIRIRK